MEVLPPKDPPVADVSDAASLSASAVPRKRRRWLVPTLVAAVAVFLLVGFFPYLHADGHRVVRVTGRLVSEQTNEPIVRARVFALTPRDLKVPHWSGEKAWGKWSRLDAEREALVQAGEEDQAWTWSWFYDNAGARSSDDGGVELLISLWLSCGESILWRSENTQDPEDKVAALWIAPEGHEPVVVRVGEGHFQQNPDGEDYPIWGNYDIGTVVVPVGERIGIMEALPRFTYHPDPIATGSIEPSSQKCPSCGKVRGYAYVTTPYAEGDHEHICPWCIADGTAHAKFGAEFVDAWTLQAAKVPEAVIAEVTQRTPGYVSWQQEQWLVCCEDACEFHGDAPVAELQSLDEAGLSLLASTSGFAEEALPGIIAGYEPVGSPAFYKFVCRHCGKTRFGGDCD